ncbi:hypothetical protein GSQ53_20945, partial [Clostridioides difficile]|nr:hypothetical protein [Clostridioides difficile]
ITTSPLEVKNVFIFNLSNIFKTPSSGSFFSEHVITAYWGEIDLCAWIPFLILLLILCECGDVFDGGCGC